MNEPHFNYQFPYLYRYEDKKFIDLFFDSGRILVSAFQVYKRYNDNQLGDFEEGKSKITEEKTEIPLLKAFATGFIQSGNNNYCFCTSTQLNPRLFDIFKRNSVFRITNITGFAVEIFKRLENATGQILFGNCEYLYERIIKENYGKFLVTFKPDNPAIEPVSFFELGIAGPRLVFVKLIRYQSQCEYRILWPTTGEIQSSIVIDCPEAIQYCEKVSSEELLEVARQLEATK